MVYIVEVKPGLYYLYRSVRVPGRRHPVKMYIGRAGTSKVKKYLERRESET